MKEKHFYFINSKYYIDFPDNNLMQNKETVNGISHGRPCFFSFIDETTNLSWLIPISSKVGKYKRIYDKKVLSGHKCDTICFGHVLGKERVFLIQNMFPVIEEYIDNEYIDSVSKLPVALPKNEEVIIIKKAKKILRLVRNNHKTLIFPDVLNIEKKLLEKIDNDAVMDAKECIIV